MGREQAGESGHDVGVLDLSLAGPLPGGPPAPTDLQMLALVADQQYGLVTRSQCLEAGLTPSAIQHRLRAGRWRKMHPGVYATVPGREGWRVDAVAAQIAYGGAAAWSHLTAGYVHGLVSKEPTTIDLLVPWSARVTPLVGVRIRRSRFVDDRVDQLHWPWRTTVDETILDVAESGSVDEMAAVLAVAFQKGLTSEDSLQSALRRRSRHSRRTLLELVLGDVAEGAESAMEVRFLRDVERAHALPKGQRQRPEGQGRLRLQDVAYPEQRVIVELDGRLGHEGPGRYDDGARDRHSAMSGWLTLRAFWREVALTPCQLAVEIAAVLQARGWTGRPRRCRRPECLAA